MNIVHFTLLLIKKTSDLARLLLGGTVDSKRREHDFMKVLGYQIEITMIDGKARM